MVNEIHPTKLAIIEAAIKLFSQKGFNGTTTKEIAQEVGIAEGTIFRHFSSKIEILYCVVDTFIPLVGVETLKKAIEATKDMNADQAVNHILNDRFSIINECQDLIRIILTETQYDMKLREVYVERVFKQIQSILIGFVQERIEKGEFKKNNPMLVTNLMLSSVMAMVINKNFFSKGEDKTKINELADIILNGIREGDKHE